MLDKTAKDKQEMVTLESLAELTGFPVKMIKEELFKDTEVDEAGVSLQELRKAMMSFIDATMLDEAEANH